MLAAFLGFSRYIYNSHFLYYFRILIALTGTTLVPWLLHMPPKVTIALTLGMVAAALTDWMTGSPGVCVICLSR